MALYLESLDVELGHTSIENIFINDFMPQANGTYVKVYLMGLRLAQDNRQVSTNASVANALHIPQSEVNEAWSYWESVGLVKRNPESPEDVIFTNLKKMYMEKVFPQTQVQAMRPLTVSLRDPEIAKLLATVDRIMCTHVTAQEKRDIVSWCTDFNLPPAVITEAFHAADRQGQATRLRYVLAIVKDWDARGLRSLEDLEKSQEVRDRNFARYRTVMRAMGLGSRGFIQEEFDLIEKWFEVEGFSMDLVLEAAKRSANTTRPTVKYIAGVLRNWKEKGITSVEEIAKKDTKAPVPKTRRSAAPAKGAFRNFSETRPDPTEDELFFQEQRKLQEDRNRRNQS